MEEVTASWRQPLAGRLFKVLVLGSSSELCWRLLQTVTKAFIVSEVCESVVPELLLVAGFGVAQSTWGFLVLVTHYW